MNSHHVTLDEEARTLVRTGTFVRMGRLEADGFDRPTGVADLVTEARQRRPPVDILTIVQTLPYTEPEFEFYREWDNVAAVPVSTFDDWWNRQVDRKTRNIVRKSEKQGVTVAPMPFGDELVAGIHRIYNESPVRHGKRFWHYGKSQAVVARENASFQARSVFLAATVGNEIVGFAKLVISNDGQQARLMQILSMIAHRDKSPTNALIAEAVRQCAARDIGYLCYGSFVYGKKQSDSLTDFKRNNGFLQYDVPRYYVPLTGRGRLALNLGLHRRLADRVPKPVLETFRDVRYRWYAFRGAQ